jgi:hypothetical protein
MSEKEGILQIQPLGGWAVCRPGLLPVKITSGELFRVEVDGARGLQLTRMEYRPGTYYSVDGYPLRNGLPTARALIGLVVHSGIGATGHV